MTMTRQQLEAVIDRQLTAVVVAATQRQVTIHASRRAILAAVDEWAASQVAAAVTPPAIEIIPLKPKYKFPTPARRRTLRRLRKQFLAAQGGPVTVLPDDDTTTGGTR